MKEEKKISMCSKHKDKVDDCEMCNLWIDYEEWKFLKDWREGRINIHGGTESINEFNKAVDGGIDNQQDKN